MESNNTHFGPYNLPLPARVDKYTHGGNEVHCIITFGDNEMRFGETFFKDTQGEHWFDELARIINSALDEDSIASIRERERNRAQQVKYIYKWLTESKEFMALINSGAPWKSLNIALSRIEELTDEEPIVGSPVPEDDKTEIPALEQEIARLRRENERLSKVNSRIFSAYQEEARKGFSRVHDMKYFEMGF